MSFSTSEYIGRQAYLTTNETDDQVTVKKLGRLHYFLFQKNLCLGALIKRPDVALMFRRKDVFAPLKAINFQAKTIILDDDYEKQGEAFLKENKIKLSQTFVYDGMSVQCENGEALGCIDSVICDAKGSLREILISDGATSDKLLGLRTIPADLIVGMKTGTGAVRLVSTDGSDDEGVGVFVVKDEAADVKMKGGATQKLAVTTIKAKNKAAESASKAAEIAIPAVAKGVSKGAEKAADLAKKGAAKAKEKATPVLENGKAAAADLAEEGKARAKEKAEKNAEAFKLGFSGFKEEFKKAYSGEDDK